MGTGLGHSCGSVDSLPLKLNIHQNPLPSQGEETPLIWASYHGHLPIVSLLLGSGANVNAQDKVCVIPSQ